MQRIFFPFIVLCLLSIVLARLHMGGWSTDYFVVHGEVFHNPETAIEAVRPVAEGGYDGQFFTRLAFNPFHLETTAYGIQLDRVAYRAQRILYPFTAWILALGNETFVPFSMIAINACSIIVLYFMLVSLFARVAPTSSPIYPVIGALIPGLLFALGRNLSEPLGIVLAIGGITGLLNKKYLMSFCFFALACLVRETYCITLFAAGLWLLVEQHDTRAQRITRVLILWSAVIPMICWQGWLYTKMGTIGPLDSPKNITFPFGGLFQQLSFWTANPNGKSAANLLYLLWHASLGVLVLYGFRKISNDKLFKSNSANTLLSSIWIFLTLFSLSFSTLIWEDAWAFCRILSEWSVVSLLLLAISRPRLPSWFMLWSLTMSGLSILRLVTRL